MNGIRIQWKSVWIIVAISAANLGLHWAVKHYGFDDSSVEVIKDQVFILILGQTHKAIRPDARADDPVKP